MKKTILIIAFLCISSIGSVFAQNDNTVYFDSGGTQYTVEEIEIWKRINAEEITNKTTYSYRSRFSISSYMLNNDKALVYLILTSKSIETDKDKQSWFDLYPQMKSEQIYKLYGILIKEGYKLREIDKQYKKNKEEIKRKYNL
ncbi:MAG: hypothetical protein LBS42_09915 [Tannerella sp.]|jgi:hypothetical protein|nr:hypothetical protein [Tannerella sp.]